jgi:carboxymethylenebutenolidase
MIEQQVEIATPEGSMTTFVVHPEHDGPHPVVLYLMSGLGISRPFLDMASRLASAGYYLLVPNLFYRGGPYREYTPGGEMGERTAYIQTVTRANIVSDARALLDYADADPAAADGPVGTVGFCMTGGLTIVLARELPDRIAAAASIHGGRMVTDEPDSPHRGLDTVTGELYIGWADQDRHAPPETVPVMRAALDDAGVRYRFDFLTDAVHGYAMSGGDRYHRGAAELHWERVHSLLRRNLVGAQVAAGR